MFIPFLINVRPASGTIFHVFAVPRFVIWGPMRGPMMWRVNFTKRWRWNYRTALHLARGMGRYGRIRPGHHSKATGDNKLPVRIAGLSIRAHRWPVIAPGGNGRHNRCKMGRFGGVAAGRKFLSPAWLHVAV